MDTASTEALFQVLGNIFFLQGETHVWVNFKITINHEMIVFKGKNWELEFAMIKTNKQKTKKITTSSLKKQTKLVSILMAD